MLRGAEFPVSKEGAGEYAEVFDGVVEVEDLNGGGEVKAGVFPNPGGSIAKEDKDLGKGESAPDGFGSELCAALAAVSHGADIAGGVRIAHGVAVFVGGGLGEDAAEFGLAGAGAAVGLFAFSAGEFLGAGGDAGAVVFKVKDGYGFCGGVRRKGWQGGR